VRRVRGGILVRARCGHCCRGSHRSDLASGVGDRETWRLEPFGTDVVGSPFRTSRTVLAGDFSLLGSFGRIGVLAAVMLVFTTGFFANSSMRWGRSPELAREAGLADAQGTFRDCARR